MQDSNWFYSALAQCAAAIIGIISAIIISRIMMFSGEKHGLQNRITELESEISDIEDQIEKASYEEVKHGGVNIDDIEKWNKSIRSQITSRQNIVIGLDEKIDSIALPKHTSMGIIILILSSLVSVVLPLSILLLSNSILNLSINDHIKIGWIVLFLFILSLISIFSYILYEIKYLNNEFTWKLRKC